MCFYLTFAWHFLVTIDSADGVLEYWLNIFDHHVISISERVHHCVYEALCSRLSEPRCQQQLEHVQWHSPVMPRGPCRGATKPWWVIP